MLSILIPVYNFNVTELVKELCFQANEGKITYEIILMDDCSEEKYKKINQSCKAIESLIYIELPFNIGRARIRNKLAEISKYPYLLFIDCDSKINESNYLRNYLYSINTELVICGGRTYSETKPSDRDKYLRWLYGVKRESNDAFKRNLDPNKSFMTNNFIISRELFLKLKFDENITSYGHEDTLFGIELKKNKVTIRHIDNALIHTGLETAAEFIKKTKGGIENLMYISSYYPDNDLLISYIKILKYGHLLKKLHLSGLMGYFFSASEKHLLKNLLGKKPLLLIFDIYKLGYLCRLEKFHNK